MFKNKERIVFLAPLSSLSGRPRLYKIANFVNQKLPKLRILHIGWKRIEGEDVEVGLNYIVEKKIILNGGGYGGNRIKFFYFLWILKAFFSCLKLKKTDVVWALGFESAFPALLASRFKGYKVVFDDADRFSMLFSFPKPIKSIIVFFEKFTSRNVNLHVIPGVERYDFHSSKFHVLKNMPSLIEVQKAKEIFKIKDWIKSDLVININGFLQKNRGLDVALELSKRLADYDVKFIVAGRLACEEAEELIKNDNVTYIGKVNNAEALATYFASDLVLTYFKPESVINTLAESNKWGDAIKIGVGILVNKEVLTAQYLRDSNACVSVEYQNIDLLVDKIRELVLDKTKLKVLKNNVKAISDKYDYFENQLKEIIY